MRYRIKTEEKKIHIISTLENVRFHIHTDHIYRKLR